MSVQRYNNPYGGINWASVAGPAAEWAGRQVGGYANRMYNNVLTSYPKKDKWQYMAEKKFGQGKSSFPKKKQRMMGIRKGNVSSAYAGGFQSKGRKVKFNKQTKKAYGGVNSTFEIGGKVESNSQSVVFGFTTMPYTKLWDLYWKIILKKLIDRTGSTLRNFSHIVSSDYMSSGDQVTVYFDTTPGFASQITHTVAVTDTWQTIVNTFVGSAALRGEEVVLKNIRFVPTTNAVGTAVDKPLVRLDLEGAYIDLYMKTSYKMQNRTINSAEDDDIEDVDNVPLYGKIYSGGGNGTVQPSGINVNVTLPLIGNPSTGLISGSAGDPGLNEPISAVYFKQVKNQSSVKINPGQLKTTVISDKQSFHVNRLRTLIIQAYQGAVIRNTLGKYSFFILERMIQTEAVPLSISVGVEANHYASLNMHFKRNNLTVPEFTQQYF